MGNPDCRGGGGEGGGGGGGEEKVHWSRCVARTVDGGEGSVGRGQA